MKLFFVKFPNFNKHLHVFQNLVYHCAKSQCLHHLLRLDYSGRIQLRFMNYLL